VELECAFDVVGKILIRGFNGIYLVRKEKSVEDVVTFGPTAQATLVVMEPTIVTNCHEIYPIANTSLDIILCTIYVPLQIEILISQ
jgi:hypothetical protein